ncbi:MAG: acyl-ACP--UDP-N-acetylglucosamine O-acyltransferase [Candidatus Riflebacteria bacterium]|nr:acyl-ACP--UDP-N-acetylglucosamine O-acyltransferase [Candidatus Riflebacteria bacterium]
MACKIHPTAVVSPQSELGNDVVIGPYAVIGDHVVIGDGTQIGPNVLIDQWTTLGRNNKIFTGAVIGSESQDRKFNGERSYVSIGDHNTIREYVTINRATTPEATTRLGNDNAILAYCHVAHDCILGNHITISNVSTLAGHCELDDYAGLGGYVGVHQFVKIGTMSFVGGWSKVVKDVPPFVKVEGSPLRVYGLNTVGLDRRQVSPESRRMLRKAYNLIFRSDYNVSQAVEVIRSEIEMTPEIQTFLAFLERSTRGIARNNGEHGEG